jgi:hypothetical protein
MQTHLYSPFIPSVWKLITPPRMQIFLWLESNNKLLTRENWKIVPVSFVQSRKQLNTCFLGVWWLGRSGRWCLNVWIFL